MVVTCQHVTLSSWESNPSSKRSSNLMDLLSSNTSKTMKVSGFTQKWPEPGPQYYSERGEDCPPRLDPDLFEYLSKGEEFTHMFLKVEPGSVMIYMSSIVRNLKLSKSLRFSDYCL